jgi:hypothetical protein
MSRYARACDGGGWSGGSGIIPLSEGEARDVLERLGNVAALERYFQIDEA